jgi:hypothetical protein
MFVLALGDNVNHEQDACRRSHQNFWPEGEDVAERWGWQWHG